MKKILGLDLGTSSIGWALVNEAEYEDEKSSIIRVGVRVNPLTVDEKSNFESGKSITTNADRTLKRSMRRNLQRYKLRRESLISILQEYGIIPESFINAEQGSGSTYSTIKLRAKAAEEEISLSELARVLLMINKKRGYRSSRKAKSAEDGQAVDSMQTAEILQERGITPGEYVAEIMSNGTFNIPDFYRSDLLREFDEVWQEQKKYYPEILTDELKHELVDKNEKQTWAICQKPFNIVGIKRSVKGKELKKENYVWRAKALKEKLDLEALAIVLQKINGDIKNVGGYLGNISDRSKELFFNGKTIGQQLLEQIERDPHKSLKNQVYYRQDYIGEFEKIWETQARFHPELTVELKKAVKESIIFYQRPLKSQKGLVSICEFERKDIKITVDGKTKIKTIGYKVCPKSSPLFQEFKIWQILNNIKVNGRYLEQSDKEKLALELSIRDKMNKNEVLKFLYKKSVQYDMNYKEIEGNRTGAALFRAYAKILEASGHGEYDQIIKLPAEDALYMAEKVFKILGFNTGILNFNSVSCGPDAESQEVYRLWHLLYSYEGDKSRSGQESLVEKIKQQYGFDEEYAKIIASVTFPSDYGSLSTKAIRRILPYMRNGYEYSEACAKAGYRHSASSLTKDERNAKEYKDKLDQLPKNSLRNPVVEKILNQMVNVVNEVISEYGKPDEIRLELARELKKSQSERKSMTEAISKSTAENDRIAKLLRDKHNIAHPSRNDIIRYKLYTELEATGYKTLYSNTHITSVENLFTKEFDIEHIIPQSRFFDDSFANKTLEARDINIEKSNRTAYDFVKAKYGEDGLEAYKAKVEKLFKDQVISSKKKRYLLASEKDIPSGFIDRELRDSQYIAKKAKTMLGDLVSSVVTTTGSITKRLREDWQLVDVMMELNWDKYNKLGLTQTYLDKDGRTVRKIVDWTKRNDHRHHAMDALTIAFTKRSFIQYFNTLNANSIGELSRDRKGKQRIVPPIPLDVFRAEARKHLNDVLISVKAKNKVATQNVNISRTKNGVNKKVQLTPRGQLHNETIYGSIQRYSVKEVKVGSGFDLEKIQTVASPRYRHALEQRLAAHDNDPKKAFAQRNSLDKKPLYLDDMHTSVVPAKVKTVTMETIYTIRKPITPDNFNDQKAIGKVVDVQVRNILLNRLSEAGGDAKKAFSNLDENPIWLNEEKGIAIKRVTITGVNNAVPLHDKRNHLGQEIITSTGSTVPGDFVNTGNNHHVAIYMDVDGNLQEKVMPFYDAVERVNQGLDVVDYNYNKDIGWKFLFTMKQNEYFVFPNQDTGFEPSEVNLMDPDNMADISPNLFRVQKLATKNYTFRHHLETTVEESMDLRDITWKRIQTVNKLKGVVKVRINHLGRIVHVGEY